MKVHTPLFLFRPLIFTLCTFLAPLTNATDELVLYVFDGGSPAAGVEVTLDGDVAGVTQRDGSITLDLTAGLHAVVVESEARAREIAEYRKRRNRDKEAAISARGSVEQMLTAIAAGEAEELPVVIKTDVHGSLEAIRAAFDKLATEQVRVRILTGGVGAISESDVSLAAASSAMVVGFRQTIYIRLYSVKRL